MRDDYRSDPLYSAMLADGIITESAAAQPQSQSTNHNVRTTMQNRLFVTVPAVTLPNGVFVPAFQVGQYACSFDDERQLCIVADRAPSVEITYHDARQACEAAGFKLISELQWLAIAFDVSQQACNWTKGTVGEGKLFQGIRLGDVECAQAGTFEPDDETERRWLTLSNGVRICDMNGNVFQWVFDDVQGDENGLIARAFADDSPSIATAPFPSLKKGMGWRPGAGSDWSGDALVRGGCWGSVDYAGVFYLDGGWPDRRYDRVGFRCTKPL